MHEVKVNRYPKCSFCASPAHYDGATALGPWAFMCESHFLVQGKGLGMGVGQRLTLRTIERKTNVATDTGTDDKT